MEKATMETLLTKLDEKFAQQTAAITTSVTQNVMEALDYKLKRITDENNELKNKVSTLEQKISTIEKDRRKQNLVFFGVEERGKTESELVDEIKDIIIGTGLHLESNEISKVYRIGQFSKNKTNRPVVISVTTMWKKHQILKQKPQLPPGINVKEDYPKEVLELRKQLQTQVNEERKKGNLAYIKYDKLVVKKPTEQSRDKRKREDSYSPNKEAQKKVSVEDSDPVKNTAKKSTCNEMPKPSILNYVERGKPAPSTSKTSKN